MTLKSDLEYKYPPISKTNAVKHMCVVDPESIESFHRLQTPPTEGESEIVV